VRPVFLSQKDAAAALAKTASAAAAAGEKQEIIVLDLLQLLTELEAGVEVLSL